MRALLQDLQFSLRLMRKRPGASLLVLAALVLGIGVNTAVFSAVNASLIRPLSIKDPERVVSLYAKHKRQGYLYFSYPECQDIKAQARSFEGIAVWRFFFFNVTGSQIPEHLTGIGASASYFKVLGVTPAMGRDFTDEDDRPGATPVAIISYGLWQRRFGGVKAILGKTLTLDGRAHTIIGVLPATRFAFLQNYDIWVGNVPLLTPAMASREMRYFGILARLKPGVNPHQAQTEMDALAARLEQEYPKSNKDIAAVLSTMVETYAPTRDRQMLWLMLTASGLVLLLAWVNVVTVFAGSTLERRKELSIRMALGSSRAVLLRQLFVQSCLFAGFGAAIGLLLAKLGLTMLVERFPWALARFQETTVDSTVIWFTFAMALLTTLVSSLIPGIYAARININSELKEEVIWSPLGRFRSIGQGLLIVAEVALASALTLVSGLVIKSFYEVTRVDLGFDPHNLICFSVNLPARYDEKARAVFYNRVLEGLKAIPGVSSASGSASMPLTFSGHTINLQVDSQSPQATDRPFVDNPQVLPGFFSSMKIKVVEGREFTQMDRADAPPVAIVDETAAAHLWPGQSALGKRLRLADVTDDGPPWREVVGIVKFVKYQGPESAPNRFQIYSPAYQISKAQMYFVLNTNATFASLKVPVEKTIHQLDPGLALDDFKPMEENLDRYEGRRKLSLLLLGSFATGGIILGLIGIYGVVADAVVRRRRELAIRMALGAGAGNCMVLITRVGLLATLAGIAISSVIVANLTKLLAGFLFGVKALDNQIYLLSALFIVLLAIVAGLVPALAVFRVSPQEVLRE